MRSTTISLTGALLLLHVSFSQQSFADPMQNRALHKLFTGEELQSMLASSPERLAKIDQYLTQSFTVTPVNCSSCVIDASQFYNHDLFNMFEFEHLRSASENVTFVYRDIYEITLLSRTDLEELLGSSPYELIKGVPYRPLPVWESTGDNDVDLANYKAALLAWRTDFPSDFRALLHSSELLRIRYPQFIELSDSRKSELTSFPNGYLIVDDEIASYFNF